MEMKVDRKAAVKKLRTLVITPKSEIEPFRNKIEETFQKLDPMTTYGSII